PLPDSGAPVSGGTGGAEGAVRGGTPGDSDPSPPALRLAASAERERIPDSWRVTVRAASGRPVADAIAYVHPIDRRVVVPGQAGWTRATAADGTVDIDDARPHLDEKTLMSVHAKGFLPACFRPTTAETLVT